MENTNYYEKAIIHNVPDMPLIVKCYVNLIHNGKPTHTFCAKNTDTAIAIIKRTFPNIPYKVINHKGE